MGASKHSNKTRQRQQKIVNTGERRFGRLDADAGKMEHDGDTPSPEEQRRRELIVGQGICPETGVLYSSIARHREALEPYWDGLSVAESSHIKSTIWHQINPHTGAIMTHPAGKQLVDA